MSGSEYHWLNECNSPAVEPSWFYWSYLCGMFLSLLWRMNLSNHSGFCTQFTHVDSKIHKILYNQNLKIQSPNAQLIYNAWTNALSVSFFSVYAIFGSGWESTGRPKSRMRWHGARPLSLAPYDLWIRLFWHIDKNNTFFTRVRIVFLHYKVMKSLVRSNLYTSRVWVP